MTITITLPPGAEAQLLAQAAASGRNIDVLVVEALLEKFDDPADPSALPYDQWRAAFESWIVGQVSRNPRFDDSRESMYD